MRVFCGPLHIVTMSKSTQMHVPYKRKFICIARAMWKIKRLFDTYTGTNTNIYQHTREWCI